MTARRPVRATVAALMIAGALAACDTTYDEAVEQWEAANSAPPGTPPGTTPPPPPPPPPPPGGGGFGPNFSEIQTNVFTPSCTAGCHSGVTPSGGLSLAAANSYAQLVGIPSVGDAGVLRVAPTDPNNSYLIQKMEGTVAGVMPPSGALPQATIDIVRQWITDGAIDDRVQPSSPIRVTSLFPMSGANLNAAPTQIIAGFDRELDAATVNLNTFLLEGSGGDGDFGNGLVQVTAASIAVPGANPQTAVFDLTGVMLADDTYRVRLLGLGASVIMDLDANALDGEFGGAFPSGNGTAGGDFQAAFTLTTLGPTLDQIQAIVFTPTCTSAGCHNAVTLAGGLNLSDADTSYANLLGPMDMGVPSPVNGLLRVDPGSPNTSYLIEKLEQAMPTDGAQMPLGQLPLAQTDIDVIRLWIMNGAAR